MKIADQCEESVTGQYLSGEKDTFPFPVSGQKPRGYLTVRGARQNNLKEYRRAHPALGVFTCVTGVSGSGKARRSIRLLYRTLARELNHARTRSGRFRHAWRASRRWIRSSISIRSPIGRTPRSNPATYTGVFDLIRDAVCGDAGRESMRGYKSAVASASTSKGGRCEACHGRRHYQDRDALFAGCLRALRGMQRQAVQSRKRWRCATRARTFTHVLDMTVEEALDVFSVTLPRITE